jgi:hypothetical protein
VERARGQEAPPLPLLAVQLEQAVGALPDEDKDQEKEDLYQRLERSGEDAFTALVRLVRLGLVLVLLSGFD